MKEEEEKFERFVCFWLFWKINKKKSQLKLERVIFSSCNNFVLCFSLDYFFSLFSTHSFACTNNLNSFCLRNELFFVCNLLFVASSSNSQMQFNSIAKNLNCRVASQTKNTSKRKENFIYFLLWTKLFLFCAFQTKQTYGFVALKCFKKNAFIM